jgi:hypothetical protein
MSEKKLSPYAKAYRKFLRGVVKNPEGIRSLSVSEATAKKVRVFQGNKKLRSMARKTPAFFKEVYKDTYVMKKKPSELRKFLNKPNENFARDTFRDAMTKKVLKRDNSYMGGRASFELAHKQTSVQHGESVNKPWGTANKQGFSARMYEKDLIDQARSSMASELKKGRKAWGAGMLKDIKRRMLKGLPGKRITKSF